MKVEKLMEAEAAEILPAIDVAPQREAKGEMVPDPQLGAHIVFREYFQCRMCFPISTFLLVVLTFYAIELVNLTPNLVTILVVFAHLCESYIDIIPSLGLFFH